MWERGISSIRLAQHEQHGRAELRTALLGFLRRQGRLREDGPDDLAALLRGSLEHLAAGEAGVVLVGLEDLWLESRPQNVPGTVDEYPNWKRKAIRSLESLVGGEEINGLLRSLAESRKTEE